MDRWNDNGGSNDLPWASVFDPAANARAFSAIQAEGFRAASELVDRFARIATTGGNGKHPSSSTAPMTNEQRAEYLGATDFEPLIRSWWAMLGQFLAWPGSVPDQPMAESAVLDFAGSAAAGQVELQVTVPGEATTQVWLHNKGPNDFGEIKLRCSELLAHDGGVLSSHAVNLDPVAVAMPGRSSRGIDVKVAAPQGVTPGIYRGILLVEDYEDLWLPMAVTVRSTVS